MRANLTAGSPHGYPSTGETNVYVGLVLTKVWRCFASSLCGGNTETRVHTAGLQREPPFILYSDDDVPKHHACRLNSRTCHFRALKGPTPTPALTNKKILRLTADSFIACLQQYLLPMYNCVPTNLSDLLTNNISWNFYLTINNLL